MVTLYTDGSCSGNPGPGGWSFIVPQGKSITIFSGHEDNTTNNRMELMALLQSMLWIIDNVKNQDAIIYTDSAYISNCFAQNWYIKWESNNWISANKTPVKNKDLWEQIITYYKKLNQSFTLTVEKVKGHANDKYNQIADRYAVLATRGSVFNNRILEE